MAHLATCPHQPSIQLFHLILLIRLIQFTATPLMVIHQDIIRLPLALASRHHSDMAVDGMVVIGVMVEAGVTAEVGGIEMAGDAEDAKSTYSIILVSIRA